MTDIHQYDQFLEDLYAKILADPEHKSEIIRSEVNNSECPYLKQKILGLLTISATNQHSFK